MYKKRFGLRELPFGITPDTSFFYACPTYQRGLNTLLVAAQSGEGFIKITGEVGTGKTMLCRKFMSILDSSFVTACIANPLLQPRSLMLAVADELKLAVPKDADEFQILKAINAHLLNLASTGRRVILCIDEAQAMPLETLEALRLLTNLETEKTKLLQIVLFGQPELDRKLQTDCIRQLNQRITFQYELTLLNREEIEMYVRHRLGVAGCSRRLFGRASIVALHKASGGVPRIVNILAHKSLMLLFGEGGKRVDAMHILVAAKDTPSATLPRATALGISIATVFLLIGATVAWTFLR